jgi:hypothetical protein
MKLFGLFAFSESGRSNPICFVQAATDVSAAKKLGGRCVQPTMSQEQMMVYGMRLPVLGEGWNEFKFGNDEMDFQDAMARLTTLTKQPPACEINSVEMLVRNSSHLVLALMPFLDKRAQRSTRRTTKRNPKPAGAQPFGMQFLEEVTPSVARDLQDS